MWGELKYVLLRVCVWVVCVCGGGGDGQVGCRVSNVTGASN